MIFNRFNYIALMLKLTDIIGYKKYSLNTACELLFLPSVLIIKLDICLNPSYGSFIT